MCIFFIVSIMIPYAPKMEHTKKTKTTKKKERNVKSPYTKDNVTWWLVIVASNCSVSPYTLLLKWHYNYESEKIYWIKWINNKWMELGDTSCGNYNYKNVNWTWNNQLFRMSVFCHLVLIKNHSWNRNNKKKDRETHEQCIHFRYFFLCFSIKADRIGNEVILPV